MATEFTLFPQLITELRLEIWRLALPTPFKRPIYHFRRGCWVLSNLDLELDPNGEDLDLKFDLNLLSPLQIRIPIYSVNREARDVAVKHIQQHNLVVTRSSTEYGPKIYRHFDHRTDVMFLPHTDVENFVMEAIDRRNQPDLLDRYVGISFPVLRNLAVTPRGFESLKKDALQTFFDFVGPITTLYVIDTVHTGGQILDALESPGASLVPELAKGPHAQCKWKCWERRWEVPASDIRTIETNDVITGLDDLVSSMIEFDLEIQLISLTASK